MIELEEKRWAQGPTQSRNKKFENRDERIHISF